MTRAERAAVGVLRVERRVLPVRAGAYTRFLANLRSVPRAKSAGPIRLVFGRYLLAARPGDASTSQLHDVDELIGGFDGGRYQSYGALVAR